MTAEQKEKLLNIQCESTKALMRAQAQRPIEQDLSYIRTIKFIPIDKAAQCVKEDGSVDLNIRVFTNEELEKYDPEHGSSKIYGRRRLKGGWLEELFHPKQRASSVMPGESARERARQAFMAGSTLDAIKNKFKTIMKDLFKPDYAEIVATELRKRRDEN